MGFDRERWRGRLAELAEQAGIPGASLSVLVDGETHTLVTGVADVGTGEPVTPDTLFQTGSITKVHTAIAIMRLVEEGAIDLDAPVVELLDGFRVADADVTRRVTARHLLTHTSGIAGDAFFDVGAGDDAVERYVERLADVGQDLPLASMFSYCNSGFVILGRMIEVVTGKPWDDALADLVLQPAGLGHTVTRDDDLERFRVARGHVGDRTATEPAPDWPGPRGLGPVGSTMHARTGDLVALGRPFVGHGDPSLLTAASVAEMLRPQLPVAERWTSGDHRGLAWFLFDWSGRRVVEHGGGTLGSRSSLLLVPDRGVAIALAWNKRATFPEVLTDELLGELGAVERPAMPQPSGTTAVTSVTAIVGRYERFGERVDIVAQDDALRAVTCLIEPLASLMPEADPVVLELRPSADGGCGDPGTLVYVAREAPDQEWEPLLLSQVDGQGYLSYAGRSLRRIA